MAYLSLFLFCLCLAEDLVELEPVGAQTGISKSANVTCSLITTGATDCNAAVGCYQPAGGTECIADPCLKFSNNTSDFTPLPTGCLATTAISPQSVSNNPGDGCVNWGSGGQPTSGGAQDFYILSTATGQTLDKCAYGYLFNGSCPTPGCWKVATAYGQKCVTVSACTPLKKAEDNHMNISNICACLSALLAYDQNACLMDPRCYKTSTGCEVDTCHTTWRTTYSGWYDPPKEPGEGGCTGTCVPKAVFYKTGEGTNIGEKQFCFNNANNPNKCFYLQNATAKSQGTSKCPVEWDLQNNYCSNAGEECSVQTIDKGYYGWTNLCTDADHGAPSSSKMILVPSVLALLLLTFLL